MESNSYLGLRKGLFLLFEIAAAYYLLLLYLAKDLAVLRTLVLFFLSLFVVVPSLVAFVTRIVGLVFVVGVGFVMLSRSTVSRSS